MTMETKAWEIEESLVDLRQSFTSGRTRSLQWRKNQLKALLDLIHHNEDKIFKALYQDLGKHHVEAYRDEVGIVERSIVYALSSVEKWMSPQKMSIPFFFYPAKGEVIAEPLGTVIIFSSWNFPLALALDPLIGAISAGNTVVLKPSELAPASSSFLAKYIPLYLDTNAIKVIEGGADVGHQLLQQKWDKIFFTGSTRVGKVVLTEAAKNLTPVTLELGGKCPIILDELTKPNDLKVAVKRIAGGKFGVCSGQVCIGIDYLLVENKFASNLIELLKNRIKRSYGENPKEYLSRIVNKNHFERLRNLLKDPRITASIVHGGSFDVENLFIEPTILLNPPLDSEIMTDEIFGPILPIITVHKIEESIEFINARPKPLAIYAFTNDEAFKKRIVAETSSGSVAFNNVIIQFVCESLPFGGVGQSGFGRYHGKYSFDTFSHEKAIMKGNFLSEVESKHPPWNNLKLLFLRFVYRSEYFKLLLLQLGLISS